MAALVAKCRVGIGASRRKHVQGTTPSGERDDKQERGIKKKDVSEDSCLRVDCKMRTCKRERSEQQLAPLGKRATNREGERSGRMGKTEARLALESSVRDRHGWGGGIVRE